jgi:hypothetical protein
VWLVLAAASALLGDRPSFGLFALAVLAAVAVTALFADGLAEQDAPDWRPVDESPVRAPGSDSRLDTLTRALDAHLLAHEVDGALHDHVMAVVDQVLLVRHGVSRAEDPERAAALMGPELVRFASAGPPYPRLGVPRIDVLIDRIEAL